MIKGRGRTSDGRPVLIIGITAENIERLLAKDPIRFEMKEVGEGMPDIQVLIVAGETDLEMAADLGATCLHT